MKKLTGQAAIYTQRLSSAKEFAEALSLCYEEERYNVFKKYFCNSGDTSNTPCEHGVLSDRDVLIGLLHAREAGYIDFLAEVGYSDSIDRRGFMDTPVKIILDMSDPYSKINNRITSADLRIMDIKNKRQILAERLDFFKKRIASLRVEAKSNVALGKRESAISILREVALLSKMTITISFSLSNIDAILMSINTLETNSTIVDAYRSGAEGLRGLKKIFNISMDSIEESIEAFNTALEENHEITSAIEYGIQDTVGNSYYGASISDEDIERELNVLAEDKRQVPCAENEKPMAHSEHAGYTDILSEQLGELTLRDSGSAAHERGQEGDIIVE